MLKGKNSFNLKSFMMNHALHLIMVLMIVVIACISPKFLSLRVLRDILTQSSTRIVVALGCMFVIISGSADLSGGRTVGLAAVIAGSLAQQAAYGLKFWPELPELPVIVPVLVSILAGLVVGCANGFIVAKLKVPAFLATLGTQMVVYGANCLYFNKAPNNSQPLGGYLPGFSSLGTGNIAGACYGLAGCLEAARTGSASSSYGLSYELDAIAACIVGGCAASGGVGTVPGVFFGVIIFNIINYGLTFIGLNTYWQFVVKGVIIITAIAIDIRKYATKN